MTLTRRSMAVVPLVLLLVAGCGTDDTAGQLEGRWDGPGGATLSINSDGTAKGNDGCNELAAAWKATNDTAGTFSVTESSDAGCPTGVAGWEEATSFVLSEDTLIIEGSDGEDLTTLTRGN